MIALIPAISSRTQNYTEENTKGIHTGTEQTFKGVSHTEDGSAAYDSLDSLQIIAKNGDCPLCPKAHRIYERGPTFRRPCGQVGLSPFFAPS